MKTFARAAALTDFSVVEMARRLQRKRLDLAEDPTTAITKSRAQSMFHRLGIGKADIALGPEMTLAQMLKEWYTGGKLNLAPASGMETEAQRTARLHEELNWNIGLIEFRVFGTSPGNAYPKFNTLEAWLAWRVPFAHPNERCGEAKAGWTPELFAFAVEDAKLSFQPRLFT